MSNFDLHNDDHIGDDPEVLAALTAAFGDEGIESLNEEDHELDPNQESLEQLVMRLDKAMNELGNPGHSEQANNDSIQTDINQSRFIVFELANQLAAFPMLETTEIDRLPNYTPLPRTPRWCLGVANIRGKIMSVTDLAALNGTCSELSRTKPPAAGHKIIIVHSKSKRATTAVVVDRVIGIRNFSNLTTNRPQDMNGSMESLAGRIACSRQGHILIIEPDRLFGHPEMEPLMQS